MLVSELAGNQAFDDRNVIDRWYALSRARRTLTSVITYWMRVHVSLSYFALISVHETVETCRYI